MGARAQWAGKMRARVQLLLIKKWKVLPRVRNSKQPQLKFLLPKLQGGRGCTLHEILQQFPQRVITRLNPGYHQAQCRAGLEHIRSCSVLRLALARSEVGCLHILDEICIIVLGRIRTIISTYCISVTDRLRTDSCTASFRAGTCLSLWCCTLWTGMPFAFGDVPACLRLCFADSCSTLCMCMQVMAERPESNYMPTLQPAQQPAFGAPAGGIFGAQVGLSPI